MSSEEGASTIPARDRARAELHECEALVQLLIKCFDLLATGRMPADDSLQPERITKQLVERQNAFHKLVEELVEHQKLYSITQAVKEALQKEERKLAELGASLRQAEEILQAADDNSAKQVRAMLAAKPVRVEDVISYATKIGASYSAPPNWNPPEPLGNHLPPAPPEEVMRSGALAKLSAEEETKLL